MKLTWFGHSTFLLENDAGKRLVTDPVDAGSGVDLPAIEADVITVSHRHHDHCATERIGGSPVVKETCEKETIAGFEICGYFTYHDEARGKLRGTNTIFSVEADGQRVVHCGDLGHMPDEDTIRALKGCDVLLIPVGGVYTIDGRTAWELTRRIAPKAVVPMHFASPELKFRLESPDAFLAAAKADPAPIEIRLMAH